MALKQIFTHVSTDKTARVLKFKDQTGAYSITNRGGYGGANPANFLKAIISLNHLNSDKATGVQLPADQIINGATIEIDSEVLGITRVGQSLEAFADGVLEVNYQLVINEVHVANGMIGSNFILGSNLDSLFAYDSLFIGSEAYKVDKTKDTQGGTVIYLQSALTENLSTIGNAVYPVIGTSVKVLIIENSDRFLVKNIGILAGELRPVSVQTEKVNDLTKLVMWVYSAQIAFKCKDYNKADELMCAVSSYSNIKHSTC